MKGWVSGGESTLPVLPTMVELVFLSFLRSAVCICFVCVTRSDSKCIRYLLLHNQSAPKLSSLEGPAFIISRFLWVRNPGVAGGLRLKVSNRLPSRCPLGLQSTQGSLWERSTSKLTYVALARFSSSWAVGLKSSAPRWLLAGGCPQFLATREL